MIQKRILFVLLGVLLIAPVALADTAQLDYTGANGKTITLTSGPRTGTFYVSPYFGTLNGAPIKMYCVDLVHSVPPGAWTVNVNPVLGANLSQLQFGGQANAAEKYQQAAWLIAHYSTVSPAGYADLQLAIWNLFVPTAPDTSASNLWLAKAAANYQNFNYTGFRILTDPNHRYQEFIVTPEPGSLITFGSGLLGLAWVIRHRLRMRR